MGHFGKRPIRLAWFAVVLPALLLNYFGQGALLLRNPAAASNPFYALAPAWALYPLVALATAAAIVASQALISGAFSLTRQAVQLGYCPRMTISTPPSTRSGRSTCPRSTGCWRIACVVLVLAFRARAAWRAPTASRSPARWPSPRCSSAWWRATAGAGRCWRVVALGSPVPGRRPGVPRRPTLMKIDQRRLVPAGGGARRLHADDHLEARPAASCRRSCGEHALPLDLFLQDIAAEAAAAGAGHGGLHDVGPGRRAGGAAAPPQAQQGAARDGGPDVGGGEEIPEVPPEDRWSCETLGEGFHRVVAHYGFMETPDVPALLRQLGRRPGSGPGPGDQLLPGPGDAPAHRQLPTSPPGGSRCSS